MYLVWGTEGFFFFNRPYEPILGPRAGTSTRHVDMQVPMSRHGVPEQTWWTFSFSPAFDETGEIAGVLCITNEVTDHVLRKISLRESEERSPQILDSATDYAVIATDIEGRVQRWNTGAQHLLGWSEQDMRGQTTEPRYEVGRASGYKAFAAFPVLANDKLHGVMSFATRSRAEFDEDALSFFATLARYSAIVRSRLDTEAELRELARTLEQRVDGCDFLGYVQSEDVDAARAMLEHLLRPIDAGEAAEIDVRMTTDQGQGRWISWSFVRHRDALYGAGRDISERKLLEEQLRQNQKMEAVGQITGASKPKMG